MLNPGQLLLLAATAMSESSVKAVVAQPRCSHTLSAHPREIPIYDLLEYYNVYLTAAAATYHCCRAYSSACINWTPPKKTTSPHPPTHLLQHIPERTSIHEFHEYRQSPISKVALMVLHNMGVARTI
eukprot:GHUV01027244.1.p2 GENE.GHUV01027244.1~~GHUV01027244.1.p2  ORF type:complete len:127 (-),score=18.70 GHUV01027244.1:333-713(-)